MRVARHFIVVAVGFIATTGLPACGDDGDATQPGGRAGSGGTSSTGGSGATGGSGGSTGGTGGAIAGAGGGSAGTGGSAGSAGTGGGPTALTCGDEECGPSTGSTVSVAAGGDLQAAIDAAAPGDIISLEAGATFTGNFTLPSKSGSGCVTIRTSTPDGQLPPNTRVGPSQAPLLARVVTPGNGLPALRTQPGAHHYRLIGLELTPASASSEVYEIVALGQGETTLGDVPHHLVVDRCWVHGWPDANFKRGIGLNSADTCVTSSHIADIHSDFQDSQAIGGTNGPGPFRIINNYLEGAAENIMFGGATPAIQGLVPSDIEIRGNHFYKPLRWRAGDPANTGYTPWVKNLFELKNARNVVLDGNLLENCWVGADQHGVAIVFTPRGEGGQAPWATVENVQVTNNIIRHVGGGVSILGYDNAGPSEQARSITIRNNLFEDVRQDYALDVVRVMQFTETDQLTVDHNTFVYGPGSWPIFRTYGAETTEFVYTNNIVEYREGVWSDCGNDAQALACKLPGATFSGNLIAGATGGFPAGNQFPADMNAVGFTDLAGGSQSPSNYALSAGSPYTGAATDGTDPGFDPAAYLAAGGPVPPGP